MAELTPLRPRHLIYHFDPRASADPEADLRQAANIAHGLSAEPWLEAVVASVTGFEQELAELGRIHARIGSPFRVVLASPAADLRATLPGSPWPAAPPLPALYRAARQALPGVRLGGGMFSFSLNSIASVRPWMRSTCSPSPPAPSSMRPTMPR